MRIGFGYDVHRLTEGRPMVLGGVEVSSDVGLLGHSDADVLTHAIIDALLGAAALGDIGAHFPDTGEEWRDADSLELLKTVVQRISDEGFIVANVDSVVVLERPKLRPHILAMREALAAAMKIDIGQVSVKATTGEKMGFVGREEGVAAQAVALLNPVTG